MRVLVRRGWRVTVITSHTHPGPLDANEEGIRVIRLPIWNALGTYSIPKPSRDFFRALRVAFGEHSDVISTQTRFFPFSMLGWFIGMLRRIPVLHTERGSVHTEHHNPLVRFINLTVDHTIGWLLMRTSKYVIGVSGPAVRFSQHLGARRTRTIPNGINVTHYTPHASRTDTAFRIIFVGRIIWAKGIQDLITAVAALRIHGLRLELTIVGIGPYEKELRTLVREKNLDGIVHFLGERRSEEIPAILAAHDVFVNPSYSEGLPTVVLEAAAAGIPIIATDVGGTAEILTQEKTGILIPPKDSEKLRKALARLATDPLGRVAMGAEARAAVLHRFTWDHIADEYEAVLREIIVHTKKRPARG